MEQAPRPGPFESLASDVLRDYFAAHPTVARMLGLHEYDGQVEDLGRQAFDARVRWIGTQIDRLDAVPTRDEAERFDRELLLVLLQSERFQIDGLRDWERNPMYYADLVDLSGYLKRDYAPIDERTRVLAEQARQIPGVLRQAKDNLVPSLPRTYIDTALEIFQGASTFIRDEVPAVLQTAGARALPHEALDAASTAIDEFVAFLKDARQRANDDFAIGARSFSEMLRLGEMVDLPLDRLLALGEADLQRNLEEARRAAAEIDPAADVRAVAARLARDHPSAADLIPVVARALHDVRDFVDERALVAIPSDVPCLVEVTPPFLRWAFAMLDPAGPFERAATQSYYYVTPPEPDWPATKQEEWLSTFGRASIIDTSIHEAYPGHYLHFLHLARLQSPVRKAVLSYAFIEGWAHYCEQMMVEVGYQDGNPALRLAQAQEALLRDCRYIAAIRMHTGEMTVDDATNLFMEKAFAERASAHQEAVRGTFDPGYLNYTLGKLMLLKLREDIRDRLDTAFSLRDFHDRLLALGAPPVPLARRALLGPDSGPVL